MKRKKLNGVDVTPKGKNAVMWINHETDNWLKDLSVKGNMSKTRVLHTILEKVKAQGVEIESKVELKIGALSGTP